MSARLVKIDYNAVPVFVGAKRVGRFTYVGFNLTRWIGLWIRLEWTS